MELNPRFDTMKANRMVVGLGGNTTAVDKEFDIHFEIDSFGSRQEYSK